MQRWICEQRNLLNPYFVHYVLNLLLLFIASILEESVGLTVFCVLTATDTALPHLPTRCRH